MKKTGLDADKRHCCSIMQNTGNKMNKNHDSKPVEKLPGRMFDLIENKECKQLYSND